MINAARLDEVSVQLKLWSRLWPVQAVAAAYERGVVPGGAHRRTGTDDHVTGGVEKDAYIKR